MLLKKIIHQEQIITINIYGTNNGTLSFIKPTLMNIKDKININTNVVGNSVCDFHKWMDQLGKN